MMLYLLRWTSIAPRGKINISETNCNAWPAEGDLLTMNEDLHIVYDDDDDDVNDGTTVGDCQHVHSDGNDLGSSEL